ncbi:MAG: 4'-phosphopantetheinyl transferase superfamily protein [Oscillospiraceae bacterium]|nr:4'-phosphopantetheinyl transferase superfamily protein [Oscillospiraceae bacterium]
MDIKVYLTDVDTSGGIQRYADLIDLVSDDRRERIERMIPQNGKVMCLFSELVMRCHLSRLTGIPGTDIRFAAGDHGKPYMIGSDIHFSVSHTGSIIAFAAADVPIGVDAELIADARERVAQRSFTENERRYIAASDDPSAAFFDVWTAKEAYVKMTGEGLSRSFGSFDVYGDIRPALRTVRVGGCSVSVCCEGLRDGGALSVIHETTDDIITTLRSD